MENSRAALDNEQRCSARSRHVFYERRNQILDRHGSENKAELLCAAFRNPQNMVILSATDGKIITTLPIGRGTDGAVFNPNTMEAFSSQGDGTLTVIKENSPTSFEVTQNVQTMAGAKTLTLDAKTNRIPADVSGVRRASRPRARSTRPQPRADAAAAEARPSRIPSP